MLLFGTNVGSPVDSSNPVRTPYLSTSGSMSDTSSSRPTSPRSTHWRADIIVMSLVQDAIHSIVSSCIGRSDFPARKERNPNAFLYLKWPD